jgi:poly(A) polymerase
MTPMTGIIASSLPSMASEPWLRDETVQHVLAVLAARGGGARIVGGAVRNALMNRPVTDIDIATDQLPDQVISLAKKAGIKSVPTGYDHGTVTLVIDGQSFEVTSLRRDVETDGRHATVAFTSDWEQDAFRRDFTMNALYCDAEGRLYDPVGGYEDILAGKVRFIGGGRQRIAEDYLRSLRFFRFFAQYGKGDADPDSLDACRRETAGLRKLAAERIHTELMKLLVAPRAGEAARLMSQIDLFTGLDLGRALPDDLDHLIALENSCHMEPGGPRRLWVLLGGGTYPESRAEMLAGRLRLSTNERTRLNDMARDIRLSPDMDEMHRHAALYRLGRDRYEDYALLGWVEDGATADDENWRQLVMLPQNWPVPVFPLRGRDVVAAGAAKGPVVGRILADLEQWWLEQGFPDDEARLRGRLRDMLTKG